MESFLVYHTVQLKKLLCDHKVFSRFLTGGQQEEAEVDQFLLAEALALDFWYGGLNYQIEHHLFPTMPRNRLREAQQIVKAFCKQHSILYHETGMLQSYREIFQCLYQVSAPLRA